MNRWFTFAFHKKVLTSGKLRESMIAELKDWRN